MKISWILIVGHIVLWKQKSGFKHLRVHLRLCLEPGFKAIGAWFLHSWLRSGEIISYRVFPQWEGIGFPGIRRSAVLTCVQRLESVGGWEDRRLYLGGNVMEAGGWQGRYHLTVCASCYKEEGERVRGGRKEQHKLNSLPSVEGVASWMEGRVHQVLMGMGEGNSHVQKGIIP